MSGHLIAIDVETTGLRPSEGDRICELAAVKFNKNGNEVDKFCLLINPQRPMPYAASRISGITDDMLDNAPLFKDIIGGFLDFIGNNTILAYNAVFDVGFINSELKRAEANPLENDVVDVLEVARQYLPDLPSHKLESVVKYLGIGLKGNFHRAYADAFMAGRVFFEIAKQV